MVLVLSCFKFCSFETTLFMRIVQSLCAMHVISSNLNDLSETMIHFLTQYPNFANFRKVIVHNERFIHVIAIQLSLTWRDLCYGLNGAEVCTSFKIDVSNTPADTRHDVIGQTPSQPFISVTRHKHIVLCWTILCKNLFDPSLMHACTSIKVRTNIYTFWCNNRTNIDQ